MHAVTQGHVVDGDFRSFEIHGVLLCGNGIGGDGAQVSSPLRISSANIRQCGGGGHDVEVAGVPGQVVAQSFDFHEHRHPLAVEHRAVLSL